MKKVYFLSFLLSISSSRAVSEKNTQQTELKEEELSIEKASQNTWKIIIGGISFVLGIVFLCFLKRIHDNNALIEACKKGDTKQVKSLIGKWWVDVNAVKKVNETPLFVACCQGRSSVVKLLLNHENINLKDRSNSGINGLKIAQEDLTWYKNHKGESKKYEEEIQQYESIVELLNEKIENLKE